ncbi:MAG: hypothetical protein JO165_12095 [Candidatus Eremiobacteraeota bacterium]|nr:hypothetical protein [Candidatus Eremiobacteraeota bacterium]
MKSPVFAVLYRPGPRWDKNVPFQEQQGVSEHRDFLKARDDDGTLLFGGPFLDDSGGLAVYAAMPEDALKSLLQQDGSVSSGLLTYEVHPYTIAFSNASALST